MRTRGLFIPQILATFLVTCASLRAQDIDSRAAGEVRDTVRVVGEEPAQLRPFVVAGSVRVWRNGAALDTTAYSLDYRYGRLRLSEPPRDTVDLVVAYRTLPYVFKPSYSRRTYREVPPDSTFLGGFTERTSTASPERSVLGDPAPDVNLQRSGSISRGIIAGNNRDVALESGLRLQLAGDIAEGVAVQAVLSDENTPIQPDGTTQRLNEFDRVFIQIKARQGTATLGDYDLRLKPSEFAPLTRKLQGISLSGELPDPPTSVVGGGSVTVAGATSRGIYQVQQVTPIEGVQGPYRLQGKNGEQFIIVIANSERVYLDGILLTRGETNDYVIDYATGEVTFTSRRIIAEDSRISIEFEYTTNRFTRTLVGAQGSAGLLQRADGSARVRVQSTYLREADSRSFGQELGLTPGDDSLLTAIGDGDVFVSGGERVPFDPELPFVPYVLRDTAASAEPIFVAVTDTANLGEVYRLRFTRVPPGTGSYRRVGRSVNGILFEWVGEGRGDYVPGRLLPKPRLQEVVDLTATVEPIAGLELFGEFAGSTIDLNRRSPLDDEDNGGEALLGGVRLKPTGLTVGGRELGRVSAEWRRRRTGARFESFDRMRSVEFGRDWNLDRNVSATGGAAGAENLSEALATYELSERSSVRGSYGTLDLTGFEGRRLSADARFHEGALPGVAYRVESISSRDTLLGTDGTWFRQRGEVRQELRGGRLVPLFEFEQERRRQRSLASGLLSRGSFAFSEWRPGLELGFRRATLRATLERRSEEGWADGALRDRASAWTGMANLLLRPHSAFQSQTDVGYRTKRFTEYFRVNQKEENVESIAVRWTGRFSPLRRALYSNWFYEALTEKTPILQETYVRTGPEIGQYVWEDANDDGIRQIDEFIPERLPNEGVYSRTFVPSDTLEPVINVQARLRFALEPSRLLDPERTGFLAWLRNVSTQTTLEVSEKSKEEILRRIYLLNLRYFDREATTVNGRSRVEQRVDLFRGQTRYGATFVFNRLKSSAVRAAGREQRLLGSSRFEGRLRPTSRFGARLVAARESNRSESVDAATGVLSSSRTFDITSWNLEPEFSLTVSRALQLTTGVSWSRKRDDRPGGDAPRTASVLKLPLEARVSSGNRLQVVLRAERASVALDGLALGLAAFELTDGRGPGTSYLWNLFGQYRISQLVSATFSYDARAPSDAPVVHTVRMQVSMIF